MGFSLSASFVVLVIGALIAFGMFQTASSNRTELVSDAKSSAIDGELDEKNTAINITSAQWDTNALSETLTITAVNNGTTALSISTTDVIVDNLYVAEESFSSDVDGDAETDLWLPGETLTIEIGKDALGKIIDPASDDPDRVKLVTRFGVADARGVQVV